MQITDQFLLPDDVLLIPVLDLPEQTRDSIDCDEDDVAISKLNSRTPSTVVDVGAARLIERFREPRTVVEAVILFSREHALEAEDVLEGAYPLVQKLVDNRFLVSTDDPSSPQASGEPSFKPDQYAADYQIVRPLYVMEDTELYLVRGPSGDHAALKIVREPGSGAAQLLSREVDILETLPGKATPSVLATGDVDGRSFAVLEWCPGINAMSAAQEARRTQENGRIELLELVLSITDVYAQLHDEGVLHGDVHPRNILVDGDGGVRLIDFGLAVDKRRSKEAWSPSGGIPFYMAPEVALAQLGRSRVPVADEVAEQFSLAAMLYELITGSHYADFGLERSVMLEQIAGTDVVSFADRQLTPWPEVEAVLQRALAREPALRFPTTRAFEAALAQARPRSAAPETELVDSASNTSLEAPEVAVSSALRTASETILQDLGVDGPVWKVGLTTAPTASVNFGTGGVAYALYRVAMLRGDSELLAHAEAWTSRSEREIGQDSGFLNEENEITADAVGRASPYHSASGLHVVRALVARAGGGWMSQEAAGRLFLDASGDGSEVGYDVTLGLSSLLLGTTMLTEAARGVPQIDRIPLLDRGAQLQERLWEYLDGLPTIREAGIPYLGVAHGWAGFLYATLRWSAASDSTLPRGLEARLDELAQLSEPAGRGHLWPWTLAEAGQPSANMPGWCHGSSGYVLLWTAAHQALGGDRWMELAKGAAWHVAEAPGQSGSLCCGFIGRAYALLNFYKHTDDRRWLERAHRIAELAPAGQYEEEYPLGLYKGRIALVTLAADLESPIDSAMPFFEREGW